MMKSAKIEKRMIKHLDDHHADLLDITPGKQLASTSLTFRCRKCGKVENNVLAGKLVRRRQACLACNGREDYTTEGIRQLIIEKGGIYISGEVTSRDSLIRLNCPGCLREVEKRAHDIRRRPESCQHCRIERAVKTVLQNNDNLARAQRIAEERGGKCLTTGGLVGVNDKLEWECSLGHRWPAQLISVDNQGTWCPVCAASRAERTIRAIFEAAYEVDFPQSRPEFLKDTQYHLDGYNEGLGLAFEVNGIQHYELSPAFHRCEADLTSQQERDRIKAELCEEHAITLITIPYWTINQGMEQLKAQLSKELLNCGVPPRHDPVLVEIDPGSLYDQTTDADFKQFQDIVEQNGGYFSAEGYLGKTVNLTLTCREGHARPTTPYRVVRGRWCPDCAGVSRMKLPDIEARLRDSGWSLNEDNTEYQNAHQELNLRCPNGHLVQRTWNKWQKQNAAGHISCAQCDQEARAQEFVDKMAQRGFRMDVDLSEFKGEGQLIRGICRHCLRETVLPVEKWKNRALAPCCSCALPAYHRCHEKSGSLAPA